MVLYYYTNTKGEIIMEQKELDKLLSCMKKRRADK